MCSALRHSTRFIKDHASSEFPREFLLKATFLHPISCQIDKTEKNSIKNNLLQICNSAGERVNKELNLDEYDEYDEN